MEIRPSDADRKASAVSAVDDALCALARLLARQAASSAADADTATIHKDELQ